VDLDDLDRERAEVVSARSLETRLGPLLSQVRLVDVLFDRSMAAISDHPKPGPAAKVGLILINRVANDMRACSILSRRGYGIQGLVLASSIFEVGGVLRVL
jgi:hypothetical protein